MTGGIEAAGDAVTGAMLARAVEPAHGEAQEAGHGACLNCGTHVDGNYCSQCGQAAHLHRSFAAIGHDLAHGGALVRLPLLYGFACVSLSLFFTLVVLIG